MLLNFSVALDLSLMESSISARFYCEGRSGFAIWCSNCYCVGSSQGIGWMMMEEGFGILGVLFQKRKWNFFLPIVFAAGHTIQKL
ncbi:hypothetical protein PHAVU_007G005300 [Phaseolus vulgaris]|uniref:Uncharacterized protein n=1 Tax=Phaseolus vulgaris TaxID=3885 RepID=V7BCP5_PHAVU|nr:hypothetical protein PHAVU_007G005300g [Phaseolus vulgaris]ESW14643.1 hypothetical protein PHAVU_007G005300g [Phaseolus vulgaris]